MCLAIPGEVLRVSVENGLPEADVRFAGIQRRVCLACTPDAGIGDYVLVHAGLAIAVMDQKDAEETLRSLRKLGTIP